MLAAALPAHAAYPKKSIKLVVGFSPGGAGDTLARLTAAKLDERLGQTVVIDNKPGAGTLIAAESTVRSPADGYTLMLVCVLDRGTRQGRHPGDATAHPLHTHRRDGTVPGTGDTQRQARG